MAWIAVRVYGGCYPLLTQNLSFSEQKKAAICIAGMGCLNACELCPRHNNKMGRASEQGASILG